jgi:hypothetical protein
MNKFNDITLGITSILGIQAVDLLHFADIIQIMLQIVIALVALYKLLKQKKPPYEDPFETPKKT